MGIRPVCLSLFALDEGIGIVRAAAITPTKDFGGVLGYLPGLHRRSEPLHDFVDHAFLLSFRFSVLWKVDNKCAGENQTGLNLNVAEAAEHECRRGDLVVGGHGFGTPS